MRKALIEQLDEEVDHSLKRVSDTVAPYVDFVHQERKTVDDVTQHRADLTRELETLRSRITKEIGQVHVDNPEE